MPFPLHFISCFHAFHWVFLELFKLGFLMIQAIFFLNWSLGFIPIMLKSWSMMFNLINLVFCETLKILGLVFIRIWGFCSNWFQLIKLACWIDVIDNYFMYSTLCDDQLVNFLQIEQVVFQIFGVFVRNSMFKSILWIWP